MAKERKTILIVEDDPTLSDIIKIFLDDFSNLLTLLCTDLDKAQQIVELNKIDILLISVHVYNVRKVGSLINLAKNWCGAKVIIMTTLPKPDKVKEEFNANYVLEKPFHWEEFSSIFV